MAFLAAGLRDTACSQFAPQENLTARLDLETQGSAQQMCTCDKFILIRERFIEEEKKLTNVSFALTPNYVQ